MKSPLTLTTLPLALGLVVTLGLAGCPEDQGGACRLDSDCQSGLVCAFDGVCRGFAEVAASFDVVQTVDVTTFDTVKADSATTDDATGCAPVLGVFTAQASPCPTAALVRPVVGLVIADHDNGLAQLAGVANQVLADGFEKGAAHAEGGITLALHIDGTLAAGCTFALAWVRSAADINADCTPVFSDRMPLDIPGLVSTTVDYATLDPETHVLTGLIDKQKLLASLDESIRAVADGLIAEDVDTDGDQVPDKASATIEVLFAAP